MKVKAELLDEERIRYIYKSHMKKDFPRAELKPLKSILMLIEQNRGEGYGFYNERELAGHISLIIWLCCRPSETEDMAARVFGHFRMYLGRIWSW